MAAPASGHPPTDHLRITALVEAAAEFAMDVLEPGGVFVAKVLAGGADAGLVALLNRGFAKVATSSRRRAARTSSGEVPGRHRLPRPPLILPPSLTFRRAPLACT